MSQMGFINIPAYGDAAWKAPVSTALSLPASGNTNGDVRVTLDTSAIYEWNSSAWVSAGGGGGITSINSDTTAAQLISAASTGTDFSISTAAGTTTVAIPSASATARGLVTTGTQTIAGAKTFSSTIVGSVNGNAATVTTNANLTGPVTSTGNATAIANGAISNAMLANGAVANLSGTNSGDVTLNAVGASPSANGASLSGQSLTLQPADTTHPGVLTAADWTTFNSKAPVFDPTTSTQLFEDFLTGYVASGGSGTVACNFGWATQTTGSPAYNLNGSNPGPSNNHPGVFEIKVTATADGGALISGTPGGPFIANFLTGGGTITAEFLVNIAQLGNGTDDALVQVGLADGTSFNGTNNNIIFLYANATSANWQIRTDKAGTATTTTTTTPVTAAWHHLKFVVNAAGTSVEFFVDNVSVGTIGTNIPVLKLLPTFGIKKNLGTGAMYLSCDYIKIDQTFTTPR